MLMAPLHDLIQGFQARQGHGSDWEVGLAWKHTHNNTIKLSNVPILLKAGKFD